MEAVRWLVRWCRGAMAFVLTVAVGISLGFVVGATESLEEKLKNRSHVAAKHTATRQ